MANDRVLIYAVGDRVCHRDDYEEQMAPIVPTLREADITYCQIEGVFARKGTHQLGSPKHYLEPPERIAALVNENIHIASPNGNHAMEWGPDALLEMIDALESYGIRALGVGKNIHEARKPVIVERKGTKVAFLAYNSINVKAGWSATPTSPGFVPIRVTTHYEAAEPYQPGTPAFIRTFANRQDVEAMKADIRKAKELVDVVIVAPHVGVHFTKAVLADYQIEVAHAAIDAGADAVIGTHPHLLKAIEVYKGKTIFHSLGNWVFDPMIDPVTKQPLVPQSPGFKHMEKLFGLSFDPEYPYNESFGHDALKTGIAKIVVENKKVQRVSFIPVLLNQKAQPIRVEPGSEGFDSVVGYVKDVTKEVGINTEFRVEDGELVIVS